MEISHADLLKHIHQEFNNSGGHLSLSIKEFSNYFQLKEAISEKLIGELLSTGHYQFIKQFDFLLGKECKRLEIHPKYLQNYWLRSFLIPSEATALLELGSQLEFPLNSKIRNLEIKDQHLLRLTLIGHNIGSLPPIISVFKYLEVLKLQRCQLTSLPDSFGDLLNLKVLDLDYNHLRLLPEKLGRLKNLQELWCRHNKLVTLPDSLGNLKNLRELSLEYNSLTSLPASLGSLVHLRRLFLKGNITLTSPPTSLQNLSNLEILGLSDNRVQHSPVQFELNTQKRKKKEIHRHLHRSDVPQSQVPSLSRARLKDRYVLKVCISGRITNMICQLVRNTAEGAFSMNYMPTIGVDIASKVITVNDQEVKLILHTTAGQEYFGKLRRFYYEGSSGCIIIFDKGDRASFDTVQYWYQDYREVQGVEKPIAILGVITDSEEVTTEQGQQLADDLDCLYFESHPSDKNGLLNLYKKLVKLNLERIEITSPETDPPKVPHIAPSDLIIIKDLLQTAYAQSKKVTFTREEVLDLWVQKERYLGNQKAKFYLRNRLLRPRLSSVITSIQKITSPYLSVLYQRPKRSKRGRPKALIVLNV